MGQNGRHRAKTADSILFVALALVLHAPSASAASEEVAVVRTPMGEIVWRFFPNEAPEHVSYVKELIRRGFYDGTTFHRVIPHFVVQGGDPNSLDADRGNDGEGEADRRLKAEFSQTLHYRPGTVGMARDADPDSGSCQFFIALENLPRLDGRYTIFGEVIEGLQVARRLADIPRDPSDNPLRPLRITARLEEREIPGSVASLEAGESGEVLTGPVKPKPYDPKNVLWKAPKLRSATPSSERGSKGTTAQRPAASRPARLELAVGEDGQVLDVRFPRIDTQRADKLRTAALSWSFDPALYDGKPQKVRLEIGSDGGTIGPPTGGGAPIDAAASKSGDFVPPRALIRVVLPAGGKTPRSAARLRLTVDAAGGVTDAALQDSCGDSALDAAAVEEAKQMAFTPATRRGAGKKEPEPVAVYIDLETRFVEASSR